MATLPTKTTVTTTYVFYKRSKPKSLIQLYEDGVMRLQAGKATLPVAGTPPPNTQPTSAPTLPSKPVTPVGPGPAPVVPVQPAPVQPPNKPPGSGTADVPKAWPPRTTATFARPGQYVEINVPIPQAWSQMGGYLEFGLSFPPGDAYLTWDGARISGDPMGGIPPGNHTLRIVCNDLPNTRDHGTSGSLDIYPQPR